MIKRWSLVLMSFLLAVILLAGAAFAGEQSEEADTLLDLRDYLFEVSDDMSDEEYCWTVEKNYRVIRNFQLLFTEDSYKAYNRKHKINTRENAQICNEAIDLLVMETSVADGVWYLWDYEHMPMVDGEAFAQGEIDEKSQLDYDEFTPFVLKFLQDDQSTVKGNVILVSGGGFHFRSNSGEAYRTLPIFQDLGYNVFILQRRIEPYAGEDTFMDLQRTIRLVRYHAQEENYGGQDMIAAVGWSGGGLTLIGTVDYCYGLLTPADTFDSDYVPDEIDAVNSDLDVAIPVYGLGRVEPTLRFDNPNMPAFYMCQGENDKTVDPAGALEGYEQLVEHNIPVQLFMVPEAEHGFGPGGGEKGGEGSENWPYEADAFMQAVRLGEEIPTGMHN